MLCLEFSSAYKEVNKQKGEVLSPGKKGRHSDGEGRGRETTPTFSFVRSEAVADTVRQSLAKVFDY